MSSLGAVLCGVVVLITGLLAIKSFKTDVILSILFLVVGLLSAGVCYYIIASNKAKKRVNMHSLSLVFKEGYFVYTHPEYVLVFPPSAIIKLKETVKKETATLVFNLDVSKVEVVGEVDIKAGLVVSMTKDDFTSFKDFYEQEDLK